MGLRDTVLSEVAHDEQMTIWTGEVLGSLSVASYMTDDMDYDDVIHAHEIVASEVRSIVGHVVNVLVEATKNTTDLKEQNNAM
jgi:hypothetical protein